jgi:glutamine synthetase type III
MFIREGIHKTLYIPAMILSHNGDALDEKIFLKRSTVELKTNTLKLLHKLGETDAKNVKFNLGIEQ